MLLVDYDMVMVCPDMPLIRCSAAAAGRVRGVNFVSRHGGDAVLGRTWFAGGFVIYGLALALAWRLEIYIEKILFL